MGFFNFKKKQTKTSSDIQEEPNVEISMNSETPIVQPVHEETPKVHTPNISKKKKEKEDISDFFNINVYDVFKHDLKAVGSGKGSNGQPVEIFSFKLPNLELNTFYKINVFKYANGHYDLVFISNINIIRDELKEFVDFSCKTFGNDFMNKKSVNQDDFRDVTLGVFSRVWYGNARLENPNFTITLTLYDIAPTK